MQIFIEFESNQKYDTNEVTMIWLKTYQWEFIYKWHHSYIDRDRIRSQRIINKYFPNGILQSDFMKSREIKGK